MDTYKQISVLKAREIIGTGDRVTIVDIRDADSFAQGHIDQAKNINNENMKDFMEHADKQVPLICCCYRGISSRQAASFFAHQGFKEVYSIEGGWEAWKVVYG